MRFFKKKDVSDAFQGTRQIAEAVESLRENICDLLDERAGIERLPCDEDEAFRRVESWISIQVKQNAGVLSPSMFSKHPAGWRFPEGGILSVIAKYFAPQIEAAMKEEIRQLQKESPGISEYERSERLADVDRRILDLEMAEESIIREAEKYGITLHRRSDADPRAVLAHDSALP